MMFLFLFSYIITHNLYKDKILENLFLMFQVFVLFLVCFLDSKPTMSSVQRNSFIHFSTKWQSILTWNPLPHHNQYPCPHYRSLSISLTRSSEHTNPPSLPLSMSSQILLIHWLYKICFIIEIHLKFIISCLQYHYGPRLCLHVRFRRKPTKINVLNTILLYFGRCCYSARRC